MTVTVKGYFQQIFGNPKYLGTRNQKKVAKSAEKKPLNGNCHSSTPITATKVPGCHFKDNGHSYLFLERELYEKCPIIAPDEVEVQIKV